MISTSGHLIPKFPEVRFHRTRIFKNPPKGKKYKFKVKNKVYEVSVEVMTGREICEMAGLIPPEMFRLDMKLKGNVWKKIELDEIVDFTTPGIEKFEYVSLDQTEG